MVNHPVRISARDLALSPEARALAERLAGKLETFYDRITSCHVVIEVAQRYPAGGPIAYNVRLDLKVPGEEIVVRRHPHRELDTAIQNAFDAAGRRLQDYARRRRSTGEGREGAYLARQNGIALRTCGRIDHEVIAQSVAVDGYQALRKVLQDKDPDSTGSRRDVSGGFIAALIGAFMFFLLDGIVTTIVGANFAAKQVTNEWSAFNTNLQSGGVMPQQVNWQKMGIPNNLAQTIESAFQQMNAYGPAMTGEGDLNEKLRQLQEARDQNLISEAEYEQLRQALLTSFQQ